MPFMYTSFKFNIKFHCNHKFFKNTTSVTQSKCLGFRCVIVVEVKLSGKIYIFSCANRMSQKCVMLKLKTK